MANDTAPNSASDAVDGDVTIDIAIYEAQRSQELELNRATAAFEHAVLSPLFLLNGGAAVAFLTLLGAASAGDSRLQVNLPTTVVAVAVWAFGLLAATAATWWGYLSQRSFTMAVKERRLIMEHDLKAGKGLARTSLTSPKGTREPAELDEPGRLRAKGQEQQKTYLAMTATSAGLFVLGVVFAAASVVG